MTFAPESSAWREPTTLIEHAQWSVVSVKHALAVAGPDRNACCTGPLVRIIGAAIVSEVVARRSDLKPSYVQCPTHNGPTSAKQARRYPTRNCLWRREKAASEQTLSQAKRLHRRGPMRQNVAVEAALRDLEISFHTEGLRNVCIDGALADQTLGPAVAEALRNRLVDIRAADSVYDLLAGQPAADMHDSVECYRVNLVDGARLILVPNHNTPRIDAQGAVDWARVRRVRIMAVGT